MLGNMIERCGMKGGCLAMSLVFALVARGALVHVYQRTLAGGVVAQLSDQTLETGSAYSTTSAPQKSGYIFTHWSISVNQPIDNRDRLGRAKEVASYTLYEETTLTANYLPIDEDVDGDGVADGWEIYWYGDLSKNAVSDTDGDGLTFAEELLVGLDPLMLDDSFVGGAERADGTLLQYNPDNLQPYVVRSEPEGALFTTRSDYLKPGQTIPIPSVSGNFAYWMVYGARKADRNGRALDTLFVTMPSNAIEIVAVSESDATRRNALYWYGDASVSMESDTDGDGLTFAEELAAGTDPLMPDESVVGGIERADGALLQYNIDDLNPYVIRSNPEGVLFATRRDYLRSGQAIPIPSVSGNFAYWAVNGIRQADRHGRALDAISVTMPSNAIEIVAISESDYNARMGLYWYGSSSVGPTSDTDGDGLTFAEELLVGTDPLMPDESVVGGIERADGALLEMNLQVYEQAQGAIVGGAYSQMFTSPIAGNAATSMTFGNGGAIWPVVADLNGDGLWDLIVVSAGATNVFVNVGGKGNPEFEVFTGGAQLVATAGVDLETNSVAKLAALSLDVAAPVDALSASYGDANQDGEEDLLVSDSEGRIWYYRGERPEQDGASPSAFTLQHKVWGGSFAGFAQGLRLAAVDWEDDGDLDCLAGTADGKLMLLRDPKVGRPTNLKALAGIDNVLLTWDPNAQSRIRGYRVYRAAGDGTASEQQQDGAFTRIAQTPLPTYRDFPAVAEDGDSPEFAYKVSSVSRFYTAGNSTPTETESMPTEAVTARLGGVKFFWNDAVAKVGEQVAVMLSIENSMNYNVAGKTEVVAYDPEYLMPVKVVKTGLTEECTIEESHHEQAGASPAGEWQVTITGAVGGGTPTLPAGGGKFLMFVFEAKKEGVTTVGGGTPTLPAGAYATVSIAAAMASAPYQLGDVDGDGDVDVEDLRLLAKLKNGNGRKPTANQLKAGDFNGNGKLDNADYQALREQLKEKRIL